MLEGDKHRILQFARSLPPDDLLFLRTDITDPAIIDTWVQNIAERRSVTVLAEKDDELAGYASIHMDGAVGLDALAKFEYKFAPIAEDSGSGSV